MRPPLFLAALTLGAVCATPSNDDLSTTTTPDKDLYVVHAVVYEVGIVTNTTNETGSDPTKSDQVAVTFYKKNGSDIDFSKIPEPLFTNVTGHELTGVAEPQSSNQIDDHIKTLPLLKGKKREVHFDDGDSGDDNADEENDDATTAYTAESENNANEETDENHTDLDDKTRTDKAHADENDKHEFDDNNVITEPQTDTNNEHDPEEDSNYDSYNNLYMRQTKREVDESNNKEWSVKSEVITVPPATLVKSLAIPHLLSLNSNFSEIPVPIPNTSIVSYSSLSSHTKSVNDSTI